MTVTEQLLKVFNVERQIRGLRSRLDAAERFLKAQSSQHGDLQEQFDTIDQKVKKLRASVGADESEVGSLDARIATIREQMNTAATAKEYNAFLLELKNYQEQKTAFEDTILEAMTQIERLQTEKSEIAQARTERETILSTAKKDRDSKSDEIRKRLDELTKERKAAAEGIPADALRTLDELLDLHGDDAMAAVEVINSRTHEYSCSGCMMAVPVEAVSSAASGKLTRCPNCSCLMHTTSDLFSKGKKAVSSK